MAKIGNHKESKDGIMARIIASYRRKIKKIYPRAVFSVEFLLNCSIEEFAKYLEFNFQEGMTWENYSEVWCVANQQKARDFDLSNPSQFYEYFRYDSYRPVFLHDAGGRISQFTQRVKVGFVADPNKESPLDREI